MTVARVARRLAAILAIDMVGFSRLMEADEEGTIARQRVHRREAIEPSLRDHGGRVVKTTGDGSAQRYPRLSGVPDRAPPARGEFECGRQDRTRAGGRDGATSHRAELSVARTRAGVPWKNPEDMEHYLDALRRAGLPE